jgi:hypothetical protein
METADPDDPRRRPQRALTVARVRERPEADSVDVMCLESARIFRLPRGHARFDELLSRLLRAVTAGRPVSVTLTSPHGDIIDDVEA